MPVTNLKTTSKNVKYQASHVLTKTVKLHHFQASLIWWHCPFKKKMRKIGILNEQPFPDVVQPRPQPHFLIHVLQKLYNILYNIEANEMVADKF